jgi:alkaline phosphatase
MNNRRRFLYRSLFATAVCALLFHWVTHSTSAVRNHQGAALPPKYVFLFLADGGGIPHMEITRQYNRLSGEGMVISDNIMKEGVLGLITTHPADSLSTDSAAAATALASGCKAKIGALGMCADGAVPKTAMEVAKERGMRIGLVTNSTVYDASPAAFVCHVPSRKHFGAIVKRYLELEPEALLGGGRDQFLPKSQVGSRRDDEMDMIASFQQRGYRYASNKQELAKVTGSKVLGLFNLQEMSFELDRDRRIEPSLYDMTQTVIRILLEGNSRGFFAFIESEHIDSASHLTDVASVIHGYREFDRAVGLAYEFYKKHPDETLIIVTSDHETGGLGFILALKDLSSTAGSNQVDGKLEDLKKVRNIPISLRKASEILGPHPTAEAIDNLMKDYFKGFTLAPEYKEAIIKRQPISRTIFSDPTTNALGMMVANNTQAYWLTTTHTNHPVFVAALGRGAERFRGYQDNSDFGKNLKAVLEGKKSEGR